MYHNTKSSIRFLDIGSNKQLARTLFEKSDDDFNNYLGYENGIEAAVEEVTNPDSKHKYWAVYANDELVGLIYIYDYKKSYNKCSLGYGLLPEFRGKGLSLVILKLFCNMLESCLGIIRIQADIELTNKHCLSCFEPLLDELGFEYECTAKNYWGIDVTCKIYARCVEKKTFKEWHKIRGRKIR